MSELRDFGLILLGAILTLLIIALLKNSKAESYVNFNRQPSHSRGLGITNPAAIIYDGDEYKPEEIIIQM